MFSGNWLIEQRTTNKIKLISFKSRERINETGDELYRGFSYSSLFSDLVDWQHGAKENYCSFATFNRIVDTKIIIIQMGPNILHVG